MENKGNSKSGFAPCVFTGTSTENQDFKTKNILISSAYKERF